MYTPRARRSFLCARTAKVSRFLKRRCLLLVCTLRRSRSIRTDRIEEWRVRASLNNKRRRRRTNRTARQHSHSKEHHTYNQGKLDSLAAQTFRAAIAKSTARPRVPMEANDFRSTVRTKVWSIHPRKCQVRSEVKRDPRRRRRWALLAPRHSHAPRTPLYFGSRYSPLLTAQDGYPR